MISLVNRVARQTGKDKVDLLRLWNEEVNRIRSGKSKAPRNTKTFILAARKFLKKSNKVKGKKTAPVGIPGYVFGVNDQSAPDHLDKFGSRYLRIKAAQEYKGIDPNNPKNPKLGFSPYGYGNNA